MPSKHAVICARGGSKRVPNKNTLSLNGRPLLEYSIREAQDSALFSDIIVNSDARSILDVAGNCGAETYMRPPAYSGDSVFLIDVLREMIRTLAWGANDEVAVLFPTVPLRTAQDICAAYALFTENERLFPVVSVSRYEYPVHIALIVNQDGRLEPLFQDHYRKSTRHNDQQVTYRANYAVIWNTAARFLTQEKLIGVNPVPYVMPLERSVDIDEHYQVLIAELLLQHRKEQAGP